MPADFLTTYAWIFWLALVLVFAIVEVATLAFTFLMLAIGSVGALVASLLGAPLWLEATIAAVLSMLLLFLVRPVALRLLNRGPQPALTNVEALLGLSGTVTTDLDGRVGHVKLANGETWTARLSGSSEGRELVDGERVVVTAIEGATAVVAPAERNASE